MYKNILNTKSNDINKMNNIELLEVKQKLSKDIII